MRRYLLVAIALLAGQREAMRLCHARRGLAGPASVTGPDGKRLDFVQTERIGPFLGGSIKVIEGRVYDDDAGGVRFNACGSLRYVATVRDGELRAVGDVSLEDTTPFACSTCD